MTDGIATTPPHGPPARTPCTGSPPSRQRPIQINFRLTVAEADHIRRRADAHGISPAQWSRQAVLECEGIAAPRVRSRPPASLTDLALIKAGMGRMTDQLTRIADDPDATSALRTDCRRVLTELDGLRDRVERAFGRNRRGAPAGRETADAD